MPNEAFLKYYRRVWAVERKAMADEYRNLRRNGQRVTARVIFLRTRYVDRIFKEACNPLLDSH